MVLISILVVFSFSFLFSCSSTLPCSTDCFRALYRSKYVIQHSQKSVEDAANEDTLGSVVKNSVKDVNTAYLPSDRVYDGDIQRSVVEENSVEDVTNSPSPSDGDDELTIIIIVVSVGFVALSVIIAVLVTIICVCVCRVKRGRGNRLNDLKGYTRIDDQEHLTSHANKPQEPIPIDDPLVLYLWYHGRISNDEADNRLRDGANVDGAYLVYVDGNSGEYILLVNYRSETYRWKICKTDGGKYVLGEIKPDVPKFDTVKELVTAHRGVTGIPIRVDKNHVVTLSKSYVIRSQSDKSDQDSTMTKNQAKKKDGGDLISKLWYHEEITDKEAVDRLLNSEKIVDGSYLVYNNPNIPDQYILLVYYQGEPLRWDIIKSSSDSMYVLGADKPGVPRYHTVKDLIKAHRGVTGTPIRVDKDHVVTLSKSYVCRPVYTE